MKTRLTGLLGDTTARDYSAKLRLFNSFAEPELRSAIASLSLRHGDRVLDAGCGTGDVLPWLVSEVGPEGSVVGLDLAAAHVAVARRIASADTLVLQADVVNAPFAAGSFDLIWSINTINHLRDPCAGLRALGKLLRPGGRIAFGQSALLPDMYFAWDSRLERVVNEAVRQYYRDRYAVSERDLSSIRSLVGLLRNAGMKQVTVRTFVIERMSPVSNADEQYLLEAIFEGTWGARLHPYLSVEDRDELARLCDPARPEYALRRPDFHYVQTLTLAVAVA